MWDELCVKNKEGSAYIQPDGYSCAVGSRVLLKHLVCTADMPMDVVDVEGDYLSLREVKGDPLMYLSSVHKKFIRLVTREMAHRILWDMKVENPHLDTDKVFNKCNALKGVTFDGTMTYFACAEARHRKKQSGRNDFLCTHCPILDNTDTCVNMNPPAFSCNQDSIIEEAKKMRDCVWKLPYPTYRIGDTFLHHGLTYHLAQISRNMAKLVNIDPLQIIKNTRFVAKMVEDLSCITQAELDYITRGVKIEKLSK